jgi:hypothetical protein
MGVLAELQKFNFIHGKTVNPETSYLGNTLFGCKRNKVSAS